MAESAALMYRRPPPPNHNPASSLFAPAPDQEKERMGQDQEKERMGQGSSCEPIASAGNDLLMAEPSSSARAEAMLAEYNQMINSVFDSQRPGLGHGVQRKRQG